MSDQVYQNICDVRPKKTILGFIVLAKEKKNAVQCSFCHLEAIFVISWTSWSQISSGSLHRGPDHYAV